MLLRRICALLANRRWMARDFRWFAGCRPTGMRASTSFHELNVWQQAMDLVEEVYAISKRFPSDERFGLTAQLRRAAVSIPSSIGEGRRRKRDKAFLHHLDIALGSQGEVEVQIEIARRLGYCDDRDFRRVLERVSRVGRMLNGLIESLQRPIPDEEEAPPAE